jgi:cyanophycinase
MVKVANKRKRSNNCPVPKGILLIVGGNEDKGKEQEDEEMKNKQRLEILTTFISLLRKKNPVIEIVTTSSTEAKESFEMYETVFRQLKMKEVGHVHHWKREDLLKNGFAERLEKADGLFFTGGNQLLLSSIYGGSSFLSRLKERYIHDEIVIGGTSAGAMAFSTPMIYAGNGDMQEIVGEIKIAIGLEFLKDVCIDTHFINRNRFTRMSQVIATNPTCIGIGIEEDTAIIVREGSKAEVISSGIVTIIEGISILSSKVNEFSKGLPLAIRDFMIL